MHNNIIIKLQIIKTQQKTVPATTDFHSFQSSQEQAEFILKSRLLIVNRATQTHEVQSKHIPRAEHGALCTMYGHHYSHFRYVDE